MRRRSLVTPALGLLFALPLLGSAPCLARSHRAAFGRPDGAKVLFSGKDLAKWVKRGTTVPAAWKVEHGEMTAGGGDIQTAESFQDFQLHVEFNTPYMPEAKGQARGNSGVILQGRYEIQVLDSFGKNPPGTGDCGAVYSQSAALVNAARPPLKWQTYDITFRAARYVDGKMTAKPRVTVFQNGILVQNNTEIQGLTANNEGFAKIDVSTPGPIVLQDHHNTVRYRNVWIYPLPLKGSEKYD